jgi:hypothetical protein
MLRRRERKNKQNYRHNNNNNNNNCFKIKNDYLQFELYTV